MIAIGKTVGKARGAPCLSVAALVAVLLVLPATLRSQSGSGGGFFVPGDPKAGMKAFFEKGCARCHAVLGEGGRSAPDLARVRRGRVGAAELVAAMWNHAPAMFEKMRLEHFNPPKFSDEEMTNVFAFVYSVRSLDNPGDPANGRRFFQNHCSTCHTVEGAGRAVGPDLREWSGYRNPVSWIQAMWNHSIPMRSAIRQAGRQWPEFQDNEMMDLMAYLRTVDVRRDQRVYLREADPEQGRTVFQSKGCARCHSVGGSDSRRNMSLGSAALPQSLGQFAARMWNHAPQMEEQMAARNIPVPEFSNQEMADLIAYLFVEHYFEGEGSADRGRRWFAEKGCATCHTAAGENAAPELSGWGQGTSPVSLAAALWNHGPMMLESMERRDMAWPRFQGAEVADLMAYLNQAPRTGGDR